MSGIPLDLLNEEKPKPIILDVDRTLLRIYLKTCGVNINQSDCEAMTVEQASVAFDWMEECPGKDSLDWYMWYVAQPDFLEHRTAIRLSGVSNSCQSSQTTDEIDTKPETPKEEMATPLSNLTSKNIKLIVGKDEFNASKSRGEPLGLSDLQLDSLMHQTSLKTVEGLENWMREDLLWSRKLSGFGPTTVDRLASTLNAYRRVHPAV